MESGNKATGVTKAMADKWIKNHVDSLMKNEEFMNKLYNSEWYKKDIVEEMDKFVKKFVENKNSIDLEDKSNGE